MKQRSAPSKSTPVRFSFRALDPVKINWESPLCFDQTVNNREQVWNPLNSSMTTQCDCGFAFTISVSRSGLARKNRVLSGSRRSR